MSKKQENVDDFDMEAIAAAALELAAANKSRQKAEEQALRALGQDPKETDWCDVVAWWDLPDSDWNHTDETDPAKIQKGLLDLNRRRCLEGELTEFAHRCRGLGVMISVDEKGYPILSSPLPTDFPPSD